MTILGLEFAGHKKFKYRPLNIIEVEENRKANGKEILLVNRGEKNPENPLILKILILTKEAGTAFLMTILG